VRLPFVIPFCAAALRPHAVGSLSVALRHLDGLLLLPLLRSAERTRTMKHEGPKWRGGLPVYPSSDVVAAAADLEGSGAPLTALGLHHESITEIPGVISDDKVWPLVRAAYGAGLFERIPENGLPPLSYNLSDDVVLGRSPPGIDQPLPSVRLKVKSTSIAGFQVDFPLGLPASIIAANASYLKYYARRGFCILTYKTVRSRFHKAHQLPQWVVLTSVDRQLRVDDKGVVQPSEFKGERGRVLPVDRSLASMANSFGIPSLHPDWWMQDIAVVREFIHRGRQVLIVSVTGTKGNDNRALRDDFVRTANMAKEAGADIIELDFSCPNVSDDTASIFTVPESAYDIADEVKQTTKIPVFIKIGHLQNAALRALINAVSPVIDGIVAINTIPASIFDQWGQPMFPGRTRGGVSGWGIRSIAQEVAINLVKIRDEIGRRDTLCLLGVGGVMTPDDFKSRLDTGVDAVEICTGAFLDPMIGFKIREASSASDLDLGVAEILAKATMVLGLQKEAEQWLERPAISLNNRRPIDLLTTPEGVELVEDMLQRIEYGVYT
jgi:dihydroorotate dehydrogenase